MHARIRFVIIVALAAANSAMSPRAVGSGIDGSDSAEQEGGAPDLLALLRSGWAPSPCVATEPSEGEGAGDLKRPGDANGDGAVDIADAIAILGHLFLSQTLARAEAADTDLDGRITIGDAIRLLSFLFGGEGLDLLPDDPPARLFAPWVTGATRLRLGCAPAAEGDLACDQPCALWFEPAPLGTHENVVVLRPGGIDRPLPEGDAATSDGPFLDRRRGLAYVIVPASGWIEIATGEADPNGEPGLGDGDTLEPLPACRFVRLIASDAVLARLTQRPGEARLTGEPWGGFHGAASRRPVSRFTVPVLHAYPGAPACGPYTFDFETFLVVTNISCGAAELHVTLRPEGGENGRDADPIEVGLGALSRAETLCVRAGRLLWMAGNTDDYCADGAYVGDDGAASFRGLIEVAATDPSTGDPAAVLGGAVIATLAGGGFHAAQVEGALDDDAAFESWIPLASGSAPREAWLIAALIGGGEDEAIAIEGRSAAPDLDPPPAAGGRSIAACRIRNPQEIGAVRIRAASASGAPESGRILAWAFPRFDDGLVTGAPVRPGASFIASVDGDEREEVTVVNLGASEIAVRCEARDPSGDGPSPWDVAIPAGAAYTFAPEEVGIPAGASLHLRAACACALLTATKITAADPMRVGRGEYFDLDGLPLEGGEGTPPEGPCPFRVILQSTSPAARERVIPLSETATFRIGLTREAQGHAIGIACDGEPGAVLVRTRLGGEWFPEFKQTIEVPIDNIAIEEGVDIELRAVSPSGREGDAIVEVRCGGAGPSNPSLERICLTVPGPGARIVGLVRMGPPTHMQDVTALRAMLRSDTVLGVMIERDRGVEEVRAKASIDPAGIEVAPDEGNPVKDSFLLTLQPMLTSARGSSDRVTVRIEPPSAAAGRGIVFADEEVLRIVEPIDVEDVRAVSPDGKDGTGWSYDPFWDDPTLQPQPGGKGYRKEAVLAAAKGPDEATIRYHLSKKARAGTVRVLLKQAFGQDELACEFDAKLEQGENEVAWPIDDEDSGLYSVRVRIDGSALAGDVDILQTEPVFQIRHAPWAHVSSVRLQGPYLIAGASEEEYSTLEGIFRGLLLSLIPVGGWGGAVIKVPLGSAAAAIIGQLGVKESIVGGWADYHTWTLLAREWRAGYQPITSLEGDYRWIDFYPSGVFGIPVDRGKLSAFETFGRGAGSLVILEKVCGSSLRFHTDVLKGVPPAEGLLVTWTLAEWPGFCLTRGM